MFLKNLSYNLRGFSAYRKKTDEELIEIYKENRNTAILDTLFERYIHLVFASCMKYFKNESDAEDAAMEIFEALGNKLVKYNIASFKSWIYTTTRNHCLIALRKKKKEGNAISFDEISEKSMEIASDLNHEYTEAKFEQLLVCLDSLKREQKQCVELMYLHGLSYKEIEKKTGYDLKHVKSFIQNGKRNLKIKLEEIYSEDDE